MTTITKSEWLTELERLASSRDKSGEGLSVQEIVAQLGWPQEKVRTALKGAAKVGRLAVSKRMITNIAGGTQMIPVYRILPIQRK